MATGVVSIYLGIIAPVKSTFQQCQVLLQQNNFLRGAILLAVLVSPDYKYIQAYQVVAKASVWSAKCKFIHRHNLL